MDFGQLPDDSPPLSRPRAGRASRTGGRADPACSDAFPAQRKKLDAVLRYVVKAFEAGKRYSEKRVNEILGGYHEDTASLRRELVGTGLMKRESDGSAYWRVE